ncbi:MAG: hypothetical protein FJX77_12125, partial [Armatimonadetes bacterium]|nr:hypothetical protein [Armatimonadota bacterium]
MIRIELFGGLRVRVGDRVVTRFLTRKTAALLANLAFYLGRAQPREVLIELLWPESDLAAGRKSLSVALSAIRREIESGEGPPLLRSDHFTLSLDSSRVCTDVQEFEHALDEAGRTEEEDRKLVLMRKAAELYQGQLLPGFYEEWIPPEQARLAGRYEDALLELTQRLVARGDPSPALDYARRVVALDPLREEAHRELIRLYARCGRISDAVRQYQELEQILRRELGSLPSTVTRALFAEITRGPQE